MTRQQLSLPFMDMNQVHLPNHDNVGVLPMIISETGSNDEPEIERIICSAISGGADYLNGMPKELVLERITAKSSTFARYIQVPPGELPPNPKSKKDVDLDSSLGPCSVRCQLTVWDNFYASKEFVYLGMRYNSIQTVEGVRLHEVIRQYQEVKSTNSQTPSEKPYDAGVQLG